MPKRLESGYFLKKVRRIRGIMAELHTYILVSLHPWFVTGLYDAEGSFHVSITQNKTCKIGWQVKACFSIGLDARDLVLLNRIKSYFGGIGEINKYGNNAYQYRVTSHKQLVNVIIPHFLNYPLITQKRADFLLFKQVVDLMINQKHLTLEGLQQIINIKASMNLGLPDKLVQAFYDFKQVERPKVELIERFDPY